MKNEEILKHDLNMFKLVHDAPKFTEMCAEKITLDRVLSALDCQKMPVPTGQELWGMKIYVDPECPPDKVRFKLRGVTVAEVYAFEPKEKNQ